jgi:glycosyltransferase involved in cell wall biosynthesis
MPARAARTGEPPGVLLLTDDFPVGGLERIVVGLAEELLGRGHRVGVVANAGGDMWGQVPAAAHRHPMPLGGGVLRALLVLRRLRSLARSEQYAIFHAHQRGIALLARIATIGTAASVVEHVHNVFRADPLSRLLSFRGDVLIACATAVGRMLIEDFGRPAERVHVVLNGVAEPRTPRSGRSSDGVLRVVGAGRLTEQKDPIRFVRTVAALAELQPPGTVQATWLGDGELMPAVLAERSRLGVEAVLALPGLVADPAAHFAAADLLLLTSRHEGLPLVALEMLAVGRGAALPDVGGCADAVDEGTGLLYDPDLAPEALALLIRDSATSGRLERWARAARTRYEQRFTFERMAEQTVEIYMQLLADPRTGSRREKAGHTR